MGLKDWAKHRGMKQPVAGQFVVQDSYQQGAGIMLTGVLSAQGVVPHAAEVRIGMHDHWLHAASNTLPALVDAANPANFKILWDDVLQVTQQQRARIRAEQAAAQANGQPMSFAGPLGTLPMTGLGGPAMAGLDALIHGAGTTRVSTSVTVNGVPVEPGSAADVVSDILRDLGGSGVAGFGLGGSGAPAMQATAVVLSAHDVPETQWPAGPRPPAGYVDYALDVTGPDGDTWSATALQGFKTPERRTALSVVGASLPVLVDPSHRSRVSLDLSRLTDPAG